MNESNAKETVSARNLCCGCDRIFGYQHVGILNIRIVACTVVAMQFPRDRRINNDIMESVSRQWNGKHVPAATNTHSTIELPLETVFSALSVQRGCKEDNWGDTVVSPCGGRIEYLHRDPASRRRRRKGKSQI
jgi:hypothetical protein